MTKKDYILISKAINEAGIMTAGGDSASVIRAVVDNIADVLAKQNPRFDRERFVRACQ
jgi:hypothetical protein